MIDTKSFEQLENGWYWLHNLSPVEGKSVWRVVEVFTHEEAFDSKYYGYSSGKYVRMCGTDKIFHMDYFNDWDGVRFVKLEAPSE